MKIYTEINYEWLDGQLIETSSKSFEYTGELSHCGGGGGGGPIPNAPNLGKITSTASDLGGSVVSAATDTVSGAGSEIAGLAGSAVNNATGAVGDAVGAVGDVGGAVGDVAGGAVGAVGDVAEGAVGVVGDALGAGMDELGRVPGNVLKIAKNPLGAITGGAMNATEGVGAGATAIGDGGKGALGKLRQNNPFLAAKKGKKSGRGSAKFRRPTSSLGKINK